MFQSNQVKNIPNTNAAMAAITLQSYQTQFMNLQNIQRQFNTINNLNTLNNLNLNIKKMNFKPHSKFTEEEDERLKELVEKYGENAWITIASEMSGRNSRQCRERWLNYLSPSLKNVPWTKEEDELLLEKYQEFGTSWTRICKYIEGRTDQMCKNRFFMLKRKSEKKSHKRRNNNFNNSINNNINNNNNNNNFINGPTFVPLIINTITPISPISPISPVQPLANINQQFSQISQICQQPFFFQNNCSNCSNYSNCSTNITTNTTTNNFNNETKVQLNQKIVSERKIEEKLEEPILKEEINFDFNTMEEEEEENLLFGFEDHETFNSVDFFDSCEPCEPYEPFYECSAL